MDPRYALPRCQPLGIGRIERSASTEWLGIRWPTRRGILVRREVLSGQQSPHKVTQEGWEMAQTEATRAPVMKDVAKLAGVSHQTVSRVLNDHPSVSPRARARVEAAIAELGYRRNVAARNLVTRRSQTIGVLASDLVQYGPARTLLGLERAARDAGYYVSIATLRDVTLETVSESLDHFTDQGVDGVVVIVPHPGILEAFDTLSTRLPIVAATSDPARAIAGAAVDQRAGAFLAVQHLIEQGHSSIGHLAGPLDWYDAVERLEGWRQALGEAGLETGPLVAGDWGANSGYEAGVALAKMPEVSAIFVANDQMALGMLRAMHEQGVRVPADMSIVGYDDQPEAAYFYPPLTTVKQDFEELGRQCIASLLDTLRQGHTDGRRLVEPTLVLRGTTAPPPPRRRRRPGTGSASGLGEPGGTA